jgi:putative aminopeptidase FrvX
MVRLPGEAADAPLSVFAAHMDEIGLVITRIEGDGSLRVARSGGLQPHKIGERALSIVGDEEIVTGVLSLGATSGVATWEEADIITGLSPKQLQDAGVRIGSTAVPTAEGRGPVIFGDAAEPLIGSWTFDDRLGVLVLLLLLKELKEREISLSRPTMIAFTIHEEGGAHGAKVLAHRERPEVFVAVDGCQMSPQSGLTLDGRPAAWSKDGKAHYDQRLIKAFKQAARDSGTELQTAVMGAGIYSDASAVYDCGAAPRVATVGHVRINSHGYEVTRLSTIDNVLQTLLKFAVMKEL